MNLIFYEENLNKLGYKFVCGIDEAGRGPLAGPVFAAAVILPQGMIIEGVDDSKKIREKKREILFEEITSKSLSYSIASASVEEIEEINILQATLLAMQRAFNGLSVKSDVVLIDGNIAPPLPVKSLSIVRGDSSCESIAAASILAKVSRDKLMREISKEYPEYMFEKHKGYGTKLHVEMIKKHGVSPIHRKSFLRKILNNKA